MPSDAGEQAEESAAADEAGGRRGPQLLVPMAAIAVVGALLAAVVIRGGGTPAAETVEYQDNLAMIQAQTGRNTNHDLSPERDVPQSRLDTSDGSVNITTDRSDYLAWGEVGDDYLHQEFAFPIDTGGQFRIACEFSHLSLIHISEPTRLLSISYAVF